MKEFWNNRYSEEDYAYGKEPNEYFRKQIENVPPGTLLLPAEGEGRNAVYAAKKGWQVTAFDISEEGRKKALKLAEGSGVNINYIVQDLNEIEFPANTFDAIALIYAHFPGTKRKEWHKKILSWLKPGGVLLMEAFNKDHLKFNSINEKAGGPKDLSFLYSSEELQHDFDELTIDLLEELKTELHEGNYHLGLSAIVRMKGKKHD